MTVRLSRYVFILAVIGLSVFCGSAMAAAKPTVAGPGAASTPEAYAYDADASSTTPTAELRTATFIARSEERTSSALPRLVSGGRLAAKAGDDAVNLASGARTTHILRGDRTGGGHHWPGRPGKTPFPRDWDADRVMHEISDIATDPAASVVGRQGSRTVLEGTRGGVRIRVVTDGRDIITGYPTNLPRNPR